MGHVLQLGTCGLRQLTRPVNSSTQIQAHPCLTPKPSFSHIPPPLTMTQSHPCPLRCYWQGALESLENWPLEDGCEFSVLCPPPAVGRGMELLHNFPGWGNRMDPTYLVLGKMKGACAYKHWQPARQPPPRAWLGLVGPHLKASMTTPDSSL